MTFTIFGFLSSFIDDLNSKFSYTDTKLDLLDNDRNIFADIVTPIVELKKFSKYMEYYMIFVQYLRSYSKLHTNDANCFFL